MTEEEFLLSDRITKIKSINEQHDLLNNSAIAYSGGKDSNVLSKLIDLALPGNEIPRVYSDTGIELSAVRNFVIEKAKTDKRIILLKPSMPIKETLEKYGYPFKSKMHSKYVYLYQKGGLEYKGVRSYLEMELTRKEKKVFRPCPKSLRYQFSPDFKVKVSDLCCYYMKEQPLDNWRKENNKKIAIIGIMADEGGRRMGGKCFVAPHSGGKGEFHFQPLVPLTKSWEEWFIKEYKIDLPIVYYPPYNFRRTGCKGCPFALDLANDLRTLEKYFPAERKQCEYIWKPVYDEYRRIGYRLPKEDEDKLFDW